MDNIIGAVVTIATAIVGVALLAVLVSRNANTAGVLTAGGGAFSNALRAATGPVTGYGIGTSIGDSTFGPGYNSL